jgi:hypothetical protein
MRGILLLSLGMVICLAPGCDDGEAHRKADRLAAERSEIGRLADPIGGPSEAENLVRRHISLQDKIVVIQSLSGIYDSQAFSTPVRWVVNCGASGISVSFSVGSEDGDVSPRALLSHAQPTREDCVTISRSIGRALNTILGG